MPLAEASPAAGAGGTSAGSAGLDWLPVLLSPMADIVNDIARSTGPDWLSYAAWNASSESQNLGGGAGGLAAVGAGDPGGEGGATGGG